MPHSVSCSFTFLSLEMMLSASPVTPRSEDVAFSGQRAAAYPAVLGHDAERAAHRPRSGDVALSGEHAATKRTWAYKRAIWAINVACALNLSHNCSVACYIYAA